MNDRPPEGFFQIPTQETFEILIFHKKGQVT